MRRFSLYPLLVAGVLAGCAVQQTPDDVQTALPEQWHRLPLQQDKAGDSLSRDWWAQFGSQELIAVVNRALANNQDLAASVARLEQAWAMARMAGASRGPDLSSELNVSRQERLGGQADTTGSRFALGLTASYELDLWGRFRAERESAVLSALASEWDAHTVALTVSAETAAAWIRMYELRQRLTIAASDLNSSQRLAAWVAIRVQAGSESPLALAQQETLLAKQAARIALLRQQAAQAESLLALWLGQTTQPDFVTMDLASLKIPALDVGLPSDLLVQRPDIQAAEARLKAADGDVAAARAAMFPSLRLSATAGGADGRFSQVLDNPVYSVAGGLLAPIFNAGRLAAGHEAAQAQRRALLAHYRQAILQGFADVQMSLDAVAGTQQQWEAQQEVLLQAQRAFSLAQTRYREGVDTALVLLDTQRSLYAAQEAAVQRQADRLLAAVGLYRALGGAWYADEQACQTACGSRIGSPNTLR